MSLAMNVSKITYLCNDIVQAIWTPCVITYCITRMEIMTLIAKYHVNSVPEFSVIR